MSARSLLLGAALAAAWSAPARAHDHQPGVLALEEDEAGNYRLRWTEPVDAEGAPAGVRVEYPPPCRAEGGRLACGGAGLRGRIGFSGLHEGRMQVVVSVVRRDGWREEHVVSGRSPAVSVGAAGGGAFGRDLRLGAERMLLGLDHLAFVLALLLVARGARARTAALAAFAAAAGLASILAARAGVSGTPAPVAAAMAAGVLLVAREATHDRPGATRRAPWLVALIFGLAHGVAFAGEAPAAPAGFHLGLGLALLALALAVPVLARLVGRALQDGRWPQLAAGYLLGAPAACWLIARTVAIAGGGR